MKKFLLIGSFIVVIIIGLRSQPNYRSALFFSIKNYRCSAGDILSDNYIASITDYISRDEHKNLSASALIDILKKQFPIIDRITIAFRSTYVRIDIEPHEPICCINDSLILTSHHELFSQSLFSASALVHIPAVNVAQDAVSSAAHLVPALLTMLPSDFNNRYDLTLFNEHYLRLIDKNDPQFSVVCAVDKKNYPFLLERCDMIKKNYKMCGAFDKGMEWIADTRFAHYIVAYKA